MAYIAVLLALLLGFLVGLLFSAWAVAVDTKRRPNYWRELINDKEKQDGARRSD